MHPARGGPHDVCGQGIGASVLKEDVVANEAIQFSEANGRVKRLQGCEQLVRGCLVGECELAEGGHYGLVRAASSALDKRVV